MSDPFIGEIRLFGGNYAPDGWALCDGSLLPINGNETLFYLLGTKYGGDGTAKFALPNLPLPVGAAAGRKGEARVTSPPHASHVRYIIAVRGMFPGQ